MIRTFGLRLRVLVACVLLAASTLAVAGDPITVLSFNIRYDNPGDGDNRWELRKDALAQQIRDVDPDILCLQEALRNQLDDLHELVPGYEEVGVGRDDGIEAGEYCAILVRDGLWTVATSGTFWLSDTPDVPGSTSWGNHVTRIVTWVILADSTGETFTVCNSHFDHESQLSREASADLLRKWILHRADPPFLVTGDFNAGEDNPAIRTMTSLYENVVAKMPEIESDTGALDKHSEQLQPLRDSFRVVHPDAENVGTFSGWRGDRSGEKIDYIFISSGWDVLDAGILHDMVNGRWTSDHFPVYARLKLQR